MHRPAAVIAALSLAAVAACTPHRVEIRQGNYLSQEAVAQVVAGMDREQVRYILGTPVVASPFRPQRWDYVYYRDVVGEPTEHAYLVVWFDEDLVDRVEIIDAPPEA